MTDTPTPDEIARWAALAEDHEEAIRVEGRMSSVALYFERTYGAWLWANRARLLALVAAQAEQNAIGDTMIGELKARAERAEAKATPLVHRLALDVAEAEIANLRAELSALRATDGYQRWAALRTERDGYRDAVARVRALCGEYAAAVEPDGGTSLVPARYVAADIRAVLDPPAPREETPT